MPVKPGAAMAAVRVVVAAVTAVVTDAAAAAAASPKPWHPLRWLHCWLHYYVYGLDSQTDCWSSHRACYFV